MTHTDSANSKITPRPLADDALPVKYQQLRKRNWLRKLWGWGLTILAAVNAIDFESPFPIPLTGMAAITASVLVGIIGGILLYLTYRPQEEDALDVAANADGILTVLMIKHALGVNLPTAERTIQRLWKKGYLQLIRSPQTDAMAETTPLIEPEVAQALEYIRIGQQEIAQCVFRVPLSADAVPVRMAKHSARISKETIQTDIIQNLQARFDDAPELKE